MLCLAPYKGQIIIQAYRKKCVTSILPWNLLSAWMFPRGQNFLNFMSPWSTKSVTEHNILPTSNPGQGGTEKKGSFHFIEPCSAPKHTCTYKQTLHTPWTLPKRPSTQLPLFRLLFPVNLFSLLGFSNLSLSPLSLRSFLTFTLSCQEEECVYRDLCWLWLWLLPESQQLSLVALQLEVIILKL